MDERAERIGRNEALFRSINENLEELNDSLAPMTGTFEIVRKSAGNPARLARELDERSS